MDIPSSEKHFKSKRTLITRMYCDQRSNSKRRGHRYPDYSKSDLTEWLWGKQIFHQLFDEWENSGREKNLIPSCDRVDNSKGYSLENIRLTTWGDNNRRGYAEHPTGYANKRAIGVRGTFPDGTTKIYGSIGEAGRDTETNKGHISRCCKGNLKFAGNIKWEYFKE